MSIEDTLNERENTHGDFRVTASIAQDLKDGLRAREGWAALSWNQREAVDLICTKLARIISGNPYEADHWRDIAGYATLGINTLGDMPKSAAVATPRARAVRSASSSASGVRRPARTRRPSKR